MEPEDVSGWQLAEVVTRLRRSLRAGVRTEYAWERLPMAQVELLQRLADEPGLRVTELAARHRLATNTVSTLVQQMVDAGLVERSPDPADRRATTITLTADGHAQLLGWLQANARRLQEALAELGAADRGAILDVVPALTRLVEALERGATGEGADR